MGMLKKKWQFSGVASVRPAFHNEASAFGNSL